MSEEIWKDIPGFPHYQASSHGHIRRISCQFGMLLNPIVLTGHKNANGYMQVKVSVPGNGSKKRYVHQLIMLAFHGKDRQNRPTINHKNGVRHDNSVENLEYATWADQGKQRQIHGTQKGSKTASAKLDEEKVKVVKLALATGACKHKIASLYDVSFKAIASIEQGRSWTHVELPDLKKGA